MSSKQIDVTCPCCSSKLSIDVLTTRVMKTERSDIPAGGDKWASAQSKVRGRTDAGAEKLENALEEERGKKSRLDDLFKAARDKVERGEE